MTTVNLDMLAALRKAGVPEELAEKAAAQIPPAASLVTKADLEVALARLELKLVKWMIGTQAATIAVLGLLMKFLLPS